MKKLKRLRKFSKSRSRSSTGSSSSLNSSSLNKSQGGNQGMNRKTQRDFDLVFGDLSDADASEVENLSSESDSDFSTFNLSSDDDVSEQLHSLAHSLSISHKTVQGNQKLLIKIYESNESRSEKLYALFAILFAIQLLYFKSEHYGFISYYQPVITYLTMAIGFAYSLMCLLRVNVVSKDLDLKTKAHELSKYNLKSKSIPSKLKWKLKKNINDTNGTSGNLSHNQQLCATASQREAVFMNDFEFKKSESKFSSKGKTEEHVEDLWESERNSVSNREGEYLRYRSASCTSIGVDGWVIKTKNEFQAVKHLRQRLEDVADQCKDRALDMSDTTLIRFVRARKLNLDKAEHMFRNALAWRKRFKPLQYQEGIYTPPKLFREYIPGGLCGYDKEGSPVFYDRLGQLDISGMARRKPEVEEYLRFMAQRAEKAQTALAKASDLTPTRPQYQILLVEDLTGLCYSRHFNRQGFKIMKQMLYQDDHYYPEHAKKIIVINAPKAFDIFWSVFKHFLDPGTRMKIEIYSGPAKEVLLRHISKEQLPMFLGGEFTDENDDPECAIYICPGGLIPSHFE
eukprot:CAMPEP_0204868712 /NCGR_PEP_ID=MMETSP1348-20121228/27634_1 /ASSEMBLY_ACC=CAM_ASM_000700 /TAXON_ID=215587 /ORGANISM="Aplanochytrium stocchinoi, Strain GSBS06" /LENGTH=568 /DNA_ID=CAMNT_0052021773 /DNA_START=307 /DNA_END=2013 /DNA_ORIENTATION=-